MMKTIKELQLLDSWILLLSSEMAWMLLSRILSPIVSWSASYCFQGLTVKSKPRVGWNFSFYLLPLYYVGVFIRYWFSFLKFNSDQVQHSFPFAPCNYICRHAAFHVLIFNCCSFANEASVVLFTNQSDFVATRFMKSRSEFWRTHFVRKTTDARIANQISDVVVCCCSRARLPSAPREGTDSCGKPHLSHRCCLFVFLTIIMFFSSPRVLTL